jgi:hypothetical protein
MIALSCLIFTSIYLESIVSYHVHSSAHIKTYSFQNYPNPFNLQSSFLSSSSAEASSIDYPIKIKNVISKMTSVMQRALNDKISRMEIELPPAVSFGVETKSSSKESNADMIKTSNREAVRLVTEMFNMLASSTAVLFPSGMVDLSQSLP